MSDLSVNPSIAQLKRFLYLGDESKTYPQSVTFPFGGLSFEELRKDISNHELSEAITEAYNSNHFLHEDTILYALAILLSKGEFSIVEDLVLKICSSAKLLLSLTNIYTKIKGKSGFSRRTRNLVKYYYTKKPAKDLAVDVTRFKSCRKWTHKDVLCMAHIKSENKGISAVLKYLVRGIEAAETEFNSDSDMESVLKYLRGVYELTHCTSPTTAAGLIELHDLHMEHVPNKILKSREVSLCIIPRLPLHQLLEQLPHFNKVGVFKPGNPHCQAVLERLNAAVEDFDENLGPMETFLAVRKWQVSNKIVPNQPKARTATPEIEAALEKLHAVSLTKVKATEKRYLVALDIQPSMNLSKCSGCPAVTPSHVGDILLLSLLKSEKSNVNAVIFSKEEVVLAELNPDMTLNDVVDTLGEIPAGPVVLSAPINWALNKKIPIDSFVVFTDHVASADGSDFVNIFKEYKETMRLPDSKFIISSLCDLSSTFVPEDPTLLNIAGFNPKLLKIIQDFSRNVF